MEFLTSIELILQFGDIAFGNFIIVIEIIIIIDSPSLEDRFNSMEAIRDTWRNGDKTKIQLNNNNNNNNSDIVENEENINELEFDNRDKSILNNRYSPSSMMWRSTLVIDKSVLETVDEEEILSNNYNLDHSFEKQK